MTYRDWPTSLTENANQFEFAPLDPDLNPELRVTTWSNVFGSGGKVSVDYKVMRKRDDGPDFEVTRSLASITRDRDGSVLEEREHLQDLVDEWNEDAAGNWRLLVNDSRAKVLAYYEKQSKELRKKLADARKGIF